MGHFYVKTLRLLGAALTTAVGLALIIGSGGGGGGGGELVPPTPTTLSGVAAVGPPLAGATVTVVGAAASSATPSTTTAADGSYSVDVTGLQGPLAVRVVGNSEGGAQTFLAIVPSISSSGRNTANITPLTHAAAALAAPNGDPLALFAPTALAAVNASTLANAVALIVNTLLTDATIATALGSNFNPLTTAFVANGTGVGGVLAQLLVTLSAQGVQIVNLAAPVSAQGVPTGVLLSQANLANPTVVPTLPASAATTDVPGTADIDGFRTRLRACLALPLTQRVTYDGTGTVPTAVASACDFADAGFRNNGRTWVEEMGRLDSFQTITFGKAQFNNASVGSGAVTLAMAAQNLIDPKEFKHPQCNAGPCAVVRYPVTTASGYADSWDFFFGKVGGQWQIVGNQLPYDVVVNSILNRFVAVNTTPPANTFGFNSRVETNFRMTFNPSGRNGNLVRAVRVKGPGLPAAGLVHHRSMRCGSDYRFPLTNQTGSLRDGSNAVVSFNNGSTVDFVLAAATLEGVPLALPAFFNYSTTTLTNLPALLPAWTRYTVEIFLFSNVTTPDSPDEVVYVRTEAAVANATDAATRQWPTLASGFVNVYLTPTGSGAGAVSGNAAMDWTAPSGAATVIGSYLFRQDSQTATNVNGVTTIYTKRGRLDFEPATYGGTTATSVRLLSVRSGASLALQTANATPNPNPRCVDPALVPVTNDPVSYYEAALVMRLPGRQRQSAIWFYDN